MTADESLRDLWISEMWPPVRSYSAVKNESEQRRKRRRHESLETMFGDQAKRVNKGAA